MAEPKAAVVKLVNRDHQQNQAFHIARLVGWHPAHGLEIQYADGRTAFAETTLSLEPIGLQKAIAERQRVLAVTVASGTVVVTGFVRSLGAVEPAPHHTVQVRVDGDRLILQGREEIELRCGQASIVLRRNGEVLIRGNSVVSRSRGKSVMTGASIRLN